MQIHFLDNRLLSTIELICGKPGNFTVQDQALNWLLFFSSVISLLVSSLNLWLALSAVGPFLGFIACLVIYSAVRIYRCHARWMIYIPFAIYFAAITSAWFITDGIYGSMPLYAIIPTFTMVVVLRGWTRSLLLVTVIGHLFLLVWIQRVYPAWILPYPDQMTMVLDRLATTMLVAICAVGYTGVLVYNLEDRHRQADLLLTNILPASIAETLSKKQNTYNIAHYFENVSILFADVVNFTPMSATMTPVELVSLLNELFSDFDTLVTSYGVEKIKTIGDCYMVAAGAPHAAVDHAHRLTALALEMQQFTQQKFYRGHALTLRIGINSGSVVAGVIGKNKFIYDLWGDAVNTASRMESHSTSGTIQITRATYELIHESFTCHPKGSVTIKGQGELEVWHVLGTIAGDHFS